MKICILTQPIKYNYGGILQAYALQRVLREMGHDVVTDRFGAPHRLSFTDRVARFALHLYKRYIGGYVLYNPFRFLFCGLSKRDGYDDICVNIERFISQNMECVDFFEGELKPSSQMINRFDALIVGSDQVWRGEYNYLPAYFLSFTERFDIKRIAYAASFGVDNIDNYSGYIRSKGGEWLSEFDAVSVREESGVDICRECFNIDAHLVLDPTMLLSVEDYSALIEMQNVCDSQRGGDFQDRFNLQNGSNPQCGYNLLMNYILNKDVQRDAIVAFIASKLSLSPINIIPQGVFDRQTKDLKNSVLPSIEDWLAGFRDSEFVVTDSFHGVVFSIIFNTPFVAVDNHDRGSARFRSLLKIYGLESRLISSVEQIDHKLLNEKIDWSKVNNTRKEWIEKSRSFIESNI